MRQQRSPRIHQSTGRRPCRGRPPRAMSYWQREARAIAADAGGVTEDEIAEALDALRHHRPEQYRLLLQSARSTQKEIAAMLGLQQSSVSRRLGAARESFAGYLREVITRRHPQAP